MCAVLLRARVYLFVCLQHNPPSLLGWRLQYLDVLERGPNYYSTLTSDDAVITRASTGAEIRKAWKRKSLELHPDKNPSASAKEEFERVKEAYDVSHKPL